MSKANKGGYQILDLSFLGDLEVGENYIRVEFTNEDKRIFKDDNFRNLYNTISNTNNKKRFVITGLTLEGVEYKDILVRNVQYSIYREEGADIIPTTSNPYITLRLYNGTSIYIGYTFTGYDTIVIEITGGVN